MARAAPNGELVVGGTWGAHAGLPDTVTAGDVAIDASGSGSFAFDRVGRLWCGGHVDAEPSTQVTPPLPRGAAFVAALRPEGPLAVRARFVTDGGAFVTSFSPRDGAVLVAGSGLGAIRHDDAVVWRPRETSGIPLASTFAARVVP